MYKYVEMVSSLFDYGHDFLSDIGCASLYGSWLILGEGLRDDESRCRNEEALISKTKG